MRPNIQKLEAIAYITRWQAYRMTRNALVIGRETTGPKSTQGTTKPSLLPIATSAVQVEIYLWKNIW